MLMKNIILTILFLSIFSTIFAQENNIELTWPREILVGKDTIVLYQPQLESFENNIIEGRMAISMVTKKQGLLFGAIRFKATVNTDLDERLVELENFVVTQTSFPDIEEDKAQRFVKELEKAIEGITEVMSLDRILASLEIDEQEKGLASQFNNDPPVIYYRESPSVLIIIDGDPIFKDTEEVDIQYVMNTPYFIVKNTRRNQLYIKGGDFWYTAKQITNVWENTDNIPGNIEKLADQVIEKDTIMSDSLIATLDEPPSIIVATIPSELVLIDGKPDYKAIEGTSLLYVLNTENDVIMDITTQQHYILLSGRWYSSKTLQDGDWKFVEPENLPGDFSKIPSESDMGNVLPNVPGTEEARMAVLEQTIPQTAAIDRKTATVKVSFDGNPKFTKIDGTEVAYSENSDKTILLINNKYYCVDDGVWFESDQPAGPYIVSVFRPDEVDDIPPESPVYNVKYVYIYNSTPDVVYVGYTPGYTCSYLYHGVVVYGTGWYYRPWYGSVYYPRPVTYGFRVHYNPWTGWGFSFGMSWGWFSIGFHTGYAGWWGPRGYTYGYRHGYYHGYRHGYNYGYHQGMRAGYGAGYRAGQASNNVYRNRVNGVKSTGMIASTRLANVPRDRTNPATRPSTRDRSNVSNNRPSTNNRPRVGNSGGAQTHPSTRENNVYAGRDGYVYRRDNSGNVQQRNDRQWSNTMNNRASSQQQINRQYQSRQQGTRQYNNYNNSRSQSGGGFRGGAARPQAAPRGGGIRHR